MAHLLPAQTSCETSDMTFPSTSGSNSKWTSILRDEFNSSMELEDANSALDFGSDATHSDTHQRPKHGIDSNLFEQILQVMVQQGVSMDGLRSELNETRNDFKRRLDDRDGQLRSAKSEIRALREEKVETVASLDDLISKNAILKSRAEGKTNAGEGFVSVHDHERALRRAQDEARSSVQQAEAERSRLTVQLKQYQIRNAQLQNQVDARNYPEEVLEQLTAQLRQAIVEALENTVGVEDLEKAQKALVESEEQNGVLSEEIKAMEKARHEAEDRLANTEQQYEELSELYNENVEKLAIFESKQNVEQNEAEGLRQKLVEVETRLREADHSLEIFLLDYEQLKAMWRSEQEEKNSIFQAREELRSQLASVTLERDALQSVGSANDETCAGLHAQVNELSDINSNLVKRITEMEAKLEEASNTQNSLMSQLEDTLRAMEQAVRESEQLRVDLKVAQESQSAQSAEIQKHLNDARFAQQAAEKRSSELAQELETKSIDLDSVMEEVSNYKKSLKRSLEDAEISKVKFESELEAERSGNARTFEEKEKALAEVLANHSTAEARHRETSEALVSQTSKVQSLEERLQKLDKRIADYDTTESISKRALEDSQTAVEKAEAKVAESNQRVDALQKDIDALSTQLSNSDQGGKIALKASEDLARQLDDANKAVVTLEAQNNQLKAVATTVEEKLIAFAEELETKSGEATKAKEDSIEVIAKNDKLLKELAILEERIRKMDQDRKTSSDSEDEARKRIEDALYASQQQCSKLTEEIKKLQAERKALKDKESEAKVLGELVKEFEKTVKQSRVDRTNAIRETERMRFLLAEAEGNRVEAMILNEELEEKLCAAEEASKSADALRSDAQNTRAELAGVQETMDVLRRQAGQLRQEQASDRKMIADLQAENEQLRAARHKIAQVYGLPEPTPSPSSSKPTSLRISSSMPGLSYSQPSSTASSPSQPNFSIASPRKRKRSSQLFGPSSGDGRAESPLRLDLVEEESDGSAPTKQKVEDGGECKTLSLFAAVGSFRTEVDITNGTTSCALCAFENKTCGTNYPPLTYSPIDNPETFWEHCLQSHASLLRPNANEWARIDDMKAGRKVLRNVQQQAFSGFFTWRESQTAPFTCGLCKFEVDQSGRNGDPTIAFDPNADYRKYWTHCRSAHSGFWPNESA